MTASFDRDRAVESARAYAEKAAAVAGGLKHGSWDSAQTLALVSIAQSLAAIAATRRQG